MRLHVRGIPLTVTPGTVITLKVSIHNGTEKDREVVLPTSKRFDLRVLDPQGRVAFDAHADHMFLQVLTPLRVAAGAEEPLGKATFQLPPDASGGTYTVEASVASVEGEAWRERITFAVNPTGHAGTAP